MIHVVICVVLVIIVFVISAALFNQITRNVYMLNKKLDVYYHTFDEWLKRKQNGDDLTVFFKENNYKTVAVYGLKEFGERLIDELKDTDIKVLYTIDKEVAKTYGNIPLYKPGADLPKVDVIVVTASFYYSQIASSLKAKVPYNIASIDDVIYWR